MSSSVWIYEEKGIQKRRKLTGLLINIGIASPVSPPVATVTLRTTHTHTHTQVNEG
jgi:hypothetical protein